MTSPGPGNAIELAVAYVSIIPETSKIARGVKDAVRDAQRYASANPINIRANIDVSRTGSVSVDVIPDFDHFADRMAVGLSLEQARHNWSITVGVDLDGGAATAGMAALQAALRSMATPIRQEVNVDVDRSGLSRAASLGSGLGSLTKVAGGASAVAAGIAAIGGAAGAALGAVSALGVGLAALGPAAAAGISTVAVGVQGIGDAFKALSAAEDAAGTDGAAQAKAVAAANDQLESALEGVTSAQRTQADAVKDAEDAHKDIARAYKDASDELEDYQFKLKDAALSEKEAALAVREARDELAKAKPQDREKALLRLQRAELRYAESVEKNKDTQEEANDAQAKGVEGSDKVVAAKDRAAQADRRVADADRQVQTAHEQVAKAQQAVTDAMTKTSAAQDKAAQAMAKLSPNARAFVLATRDLIPAWTDLRSVTQDALFDDAANGITQLVNASFPTLKAGMVDVASSMNGLTKQFAAFWAAPQNLEGVRSAFAGTKSFIDGLGPGLQQAAQGFLSLGQAAEPVANTIGAQFAGMLGQIGQSFTDAFNSGALTELIGNFGNILQGLGEGLNPLLDGLIQMGNIVGPTLGPLLAQLGTSLGALAPSLGRLGATFATTFTALLPHLDKFVSALADGLEPVLPVLGDLLGNLGAALTPLIGPLSEITAVVGSALSQAITALAPSIGPLGEAFASLITAVAPILPVIAEVAAGLIQALAPALTEIFTAAAPLIKQWGDLMLPVFRELQPVLAETAMELGSALADALKAIAPVLPDLVTSFSDLVIAVVPLLPEIARLAGEILPPLVDLMVEMAPVITKIIDAFTWLATNVIDDVLIPALEGLGAYFSDQFTAAGDVVRVAKDIIGGAIDGMVILFTGLGSAVTKVWDTIVRTIKTSVGKIGEFLVGLPEISIPDIPGIPGRGTKVGFRDVGQSMLNWGTAAMATGGLFSGVGGPRDDKNLIRISNREFVVNADATAKTLPLLQAINSGWVPSADFLHALVPGFADGGIPGKKFAQSMDPAKYLMGGFSRSSIDCSGMVAAVVNDALGLDPFAGRMSTVNEGQWLSAKGAKPGLGGPGDISIGWFDRGGGANGHTALTLGDGTNVESNGSDGVVIGGPVGASHKMFDKHMFIPADLLRGGDLGGPATGTKGGPSAKLGGRAGGTGGAGGSGGGAGAPGTGGDAAGATPVFVTNWPGGLSLGGPATGTTDAPTITPDGTLSSTPFTATPTPALSADQGTHPLSGLGLPGPLGELFNGPAPWYMAATPEQALANLGAQAGNLAQRTGSDFQGLIQNNWKEMLNTGLAVAGMGAGGGAPSMTVNAYGMDPQGVGAAVERQWRRRTMANQRGGGFGR